MSVFPSAPSRRLRAAPYLLIGALALTASAQTLASTSSEMHVDGFENRDGAILAAMQDRFIDCIRDLIYLGKPGVETKSARDSTEFAKQSVSTTKN